MDSAYLPALAALAGSATGGLTSLASAWLTLRRQGHATRLSRDRARRQKLYRLFIDEASKLYADALVHDAAEVSALVRAYALISRMAFCRAPPWLKKRRRSFEWLSRRIFRRTRPFLKCES
jgi:hypothetical protein